jgi:hypothetical protein
MKNKKLALVIGLFCICLSSVSAFTIMVIAGFFENEYIVSKGRQIFLDDNLATEQITLTWDKVPNATSYNVYWSVSSGVTKRDGNKISAVENSVAIKGLKHGTTYYFVVTAVKDSVESKESEELSYTVVE